jgi:hypothetical protein
MADKPWKRFERTTAAQFGVKRRLMKGTGEVSDIGPDNWPLILDTKLRKSFRPHAWWNAVREYAAKEGKGRQPVLVTRKIPHLKRYAFSDYRWFWGMVGAAQAGGLFEPSYFSGKSWPIESWSKKADANASAVNKMTIFIIDCPGEEPTCVVAPHIMVSVLRAAKVLPYPGQEADPRFPLAETVTGVLDGIDKGDLNTQSRDYTLDRYKAYPEDVGYA